MRKKMFKLEPEIGDICLVGDTFIGGKLIYRYTVSEMSSDGGIEISQPDITEEGECPPCVDRERDSKKLKTGVMECECTEHLILHGINPDPWGSEWFEVYEKME